MKNFSMKLMFWAIVASMLFSSCATIVSGGSPKITIDGNVGEPVTITTTKQVYSNVSLPYVVKVKRHALDGQRIYVQTATQRFKDIVLGKQTNGWVWGNLLFGGLIGWVVDLGTSCVSKPVQTHFYVQPGNSQATELNNTNNSVLDVEVP